MFAQRLKELRNREHITQEQLAVIIGVERSSVGKYESKKKDIIPSVDVLSRMADYFHVSTDYLLGRTDDPTDYGDGDLIAENAGPALDALGGDARRAVDFHRIVDEDVKNEQPSVIIGAAAHLDINDPEAVKEYNQFLEYLAYKYRKQ